MLVKEFFQGLPRRCGQICVFFFTKSVSDRQEKRCCASWSFLELLHGERKRRHFEGRSFAGRVLHPIELCKGSHKGQLALEDAHLSPCKCRWWHLALVLPCCCRSRYVWKYPQQDFSRFAQLRALLTSDHGVNRQTLLERVLQTEARFSENPRFVGWNRFWPQFFKASPPSPHADDRKFSAEPWFIRYLNRCSYLNINPIINFKFMLTWYPDLGS